jgi:hypothetical protein
LGTLDGGLDQLLALRQVLVEAARAVAHELRPGFAGEFVVSVVFKPGSDPACALTCPSERP